MNKSELIKLAADASELSQRDLGAALEAILETIHQAVAAGDTVLIVGHGSYKASKRQGRVGRNPQTGEALDIPAKTVPVFKPGKEFKDLVSRHA